MCVDQSYDELTAKILFDSKEKVIEALRKCILGLEKSNSNQFGEKDMY